MERAAGIEPACLTWKDSALPLSYARDFEQDKTGWMADQQAFFFHSEVFFLVANFYRHFSTSLPTWI